MNRLRELFGLHIFGFQHTPKGGVAMRAFKGGGCCQVDNEAVHLGAFGRGHNDHWTKW